MKNWLDQPVSKREFVIFWLLGSMMIGYIMGWFSAFGYIYGS